MLVRNRIKELWFKLSDKWRFLFVGSFNATVSYAIYSICILIIGEMAYQVSLATSWILSSVVSYTTHRLLVFNVKGNIVKQYLKCCATWVFSYLINAILLEIFVKVFTMNVFLAQFLATLCCAVFTYVMFKIFAFKQKS